jgi:polysaccharide biosynthesis transport protein
MKFLPLGDAPSGHVIWTETTPKFLSSAARSFDYVICDLPALSAMGEVRASAHHFDAFLMVVRWGEVDIDHLKFGLKSSGAFREKIAGVILNRAHPASLRRTASPSAAFFMRKPTVERRAH